MLQSTYKLTKFFFNCKVNFHYSSVPYILLQAILAAVVIANLVGLLKQFSRLRYLWKVYKPDAVRYTFLLCFNTGIFQRIE